MQKLDRSIVVAAISQWQRHLSACSRTHGGHFEQISLCFHGSVWLKNFEVGILLYDFFVYR